MLSFSKLFCFLSMFFVALTVAAPIDKLVAPICGVDGVSVRLPLSRFSNNDYKGRPWVAPPRGFYLQPWNMIYATHAANLALRNFQYDPSPVRADKPDGDINDMSSFQVPGSDQVFTSYGVDTRLNIHGDHLQYSGTGILKGAFSTYSLLAWGCDENNVPYYVNYATETELTKTPAGIDIMSIIDTGLDDKTFGRIQAELKNLGDPEITAMAANLTKTVQDGARRGLPRVTTCDAACKSNVNLKDIIGL
ncbi:hypothetical protein DM02DRAFT_660318 [Periconia macrospinosa]|uniref:Uncharacterized protein n=1 Tax=Periconia macrospinosa TaxID=97972 RepID=A0A2V1DDD3_9PLEO|nr:hypothetical protein DM02DRAFT_660318 [Periconia macrospinosa]